MKESHCKSLQEKKRTWEGITVGRRKKEREDRRKEGIRKKGRRERVRSEQEFLSNAVSTQMLICLVGEGWYKSEGSWHLRPHYNASPSAPTWVLRPLIGWGERGRKRKREREKKWRETCTHAVTT